MAPYRVHFLDHGGNVYAIHHVEHDHDEDAIGAAHRLNVLPHLGSGFEVWEDDRLVHRHSNRDKN
ncbi:MAG TPA: hypothetical protein VK432_09435 [Stellaceae bacterium]|nr:hypothetical protein [Stellaceae bacterium]